MFSLRPNTSKIALLVLDRMLSDGTFGIIDCQVQSSHLLSLGASVVPRSSFVETLGRLCETPSAFENWPKGPIRVSELVQD